MTHAATLQHFTYRPSSTMQRMLEADNLLEREQISKRLYGTRPVVGESYTGVYFENEYDWSKTKKGFWKTSRVVEIWPLSWEVGMEAVGGHVAQWLLVRTLSGTLYAVAEVR